jgi:hypothetical protein
MIWMGWSLMVLATLNLLLNLKNWKEQLLIVSLGAFAVLVGKIASRVDKNHIRHGSE